MKQILILIIVISISSEVFSAHGDTTKIRAIEFGESRSKWVNMPNPTESFQRILMNYKLRCPDGRQCGEWDYLAYVFVDQWFAPSFRIDSTVVREFHLMIDTSWNFSAEIIDGKFVETKTPKKKVLLEMYENHLAPTKRTWFTYEWPAYYTYEYDSEANKIDSTMVPPDHTFFLDSTRVYFNDDVTFRNRWEIMRYITPYGNPTADGNILSDGGTFTWVFDVSDFLPILSGPVYIYAPNGQEDLELTFDFIQGTPERDVIRIEKLWDKSGITYDSLIEERHLTPYDINFAENEKSAKLKIYQTGHGFGGTPDNCAEFCRKEAYVRIDGEQRYSRFIWKECGDNPLYPQGGTWLVDRTNWCPGDVVPSHDYELTDYITPGGTHTIDYDMERYTEVWTPGGPGSNTRPNWVVRGFLVTYGLNSFTKDAAIIDIITPTDKDEYDRFNPVCSNPVIKVRNTGSADITSIDFEYGTNGNYSLSHTWNGSIVFTEEQLVELPFEMIEAGDENTFNVRISGVNGGADDYTGNNNASSRFLKTPDYFSDLVLEVRTNNWDIFGELSPYSYWLVDAAGKRVHERMQTENNTVYLDTVNLENGCYSFQLINELGYGMGYWVLRQQYGLNNGSAQFTSRGRLLQRFKTDFGNGIFHQFSVSPKPEISTDLEELDFGDVPLGEKRTQTVEITPVNEKGLIINKLEVVLGSAKGFFIDETNPPYEGSPVELAYGEKMTVTIRFEPGSGGNKSSSLNINSNDDRTPQKKVFLVGKAIDPSGVSIDELSEFGVHPNPVTGIAKVEFRDEFALENATLSLHNILGETTAIISDNPGLTGSFEYDFSSFPAGVYFVILSNGFESKAIKLIIN